MVCNRLLNTLTRMTMNKVRSNLKSKINNKNTSSTAKRYEGCDLDFF